MELIGHRGCADQYPENTLTAVTESARHLDAIEVDVRRCGSGELVVFHDERVDALTEGTGRVADLDWTELRTLDVAGSGNQIPRLTTVLEAIPRGVRIQVELKESDLAADVRAAVAEAGTSPTAEPEPTDRAEVGDVAADGGQGGVVSQDGAGSAREGPLDVTITSFMADALATVEDLGWNVPTGYLFETDPVANLETALDLGCDAVHPHYDCCLGTDVVARAHEAGLDVVAWKAARTPEHVATLREAGVDGVTADRWDLI